MEYKFVPYKKEYFSKLVTLITESFNIKNKKKSELINWKLFSPFLNNKTVTYVALDNENNLVGHYSNVPISISKDTQNFKGMACIDMTTDINHRRKGIISELAKRVYKDVEKNGFDLSIGFSNKDGVQVDKNSSGYGYTIVGRFSQYATIRIFKTKTKYSLKEVSSIKTSIDPISYFHVEKSAEYVNWRYMLKPGYKYSIFKVQNAEKDTYVVLKVINQRLYIYDIISSSFDERHISNVITAITNYALTIRNYIIVCPVLDNKYWKRLLIKKGFFKLPLTKHLFYLTVKVHNKDKVTEDVYDPNNWILMNGDLW